MAWLWNCIYTVSNATTAGPRDSGSSLLLANEKVGLGLGWLEALLERGVRSGRGAGRLAGLLGDAGETGLLLGLCGLLWLVLWRRHALRAQRRALQVRVIQLVVSFRISQ